MSETYRIKSDEKRKRFYPYEGELLIKNDFPVHEDALITQLREAGITTEVKISGKIKIITFQVTVPPEAKDHEFSISIYDFDQQDEPIGFVRFTQVSDNETTLSLDKKINEEYRGNGLVALASSLGYLIARNDGIKIISGTIRSENPESLRSRKLVRDLFTGKNFDTTISKSRNGGVLTIATDLNKTSDLLTKIIRKFKKS